MNLIEHIHFIRKSKGISVDEFEERIGAKVAKLMRSGNVGEKLMMDELAVIASVLNVPLLELFTYDDTPNLPKPQAQAPRPQFLAIWVQIDPFLKDTETFFLLLNIETIHFIEPVQIATSGPPNAKLAIQNYGRLNTPETIYTVCSFDEIQAVLHKHSLILT